MRQRSYVTACTSCKVKPKFFNSSSSFVIRVYLLHPQPSLFLYGLLITIWCFSILVNYYSVQVSKKNYWPWLHSYKKWGYFRTVWSCYRASLSTESAVNYSGCDSLLWTKNRAQESHINIYHVRTSLKDLIENLFIRTRTISQWQLKNTRHACYNDCLECNIQSILPCATLYQIFQLFKLTHF